MHVESSHFFYSKIIFISVAFHCFIWRRTLLSHVVDVPIFHINRFIFINTFSFPAVGLLCKAAKVDYKSQIYWYSLRSLVTYHFVQVNILEQ